MEQQNEVLAAVNALATRMDEQYGKLRSQFAEQLEVQSTAFHVEMTAGFAKMRDRIETIRADIEGVESRIDLLGENIGNVVKQLSRYNTEVEAPLEHRVSALELRVTRLEKKKERN